MWRIQCEGIMCGEMQFEGDFDEGNARVSCSESSTSTKKVTSGVSWKVRAPIALPAIKYSAFSEYGYCNFSICVADSVISNQPHFCLPCVSVTLSFLYQ